MWFSFNLARNGTILPALMGNNSGKTYNFGINVGNVYIYPNFTILFGLPNGVDITMSAINSFDIRLYSDR
jgi:hypothetical protein